MKKVEAPTMAPQRCVFCTSGHRGGPVIDSETEYPFGRLYVCLLHAELLAVAAGFAEGEECAKLRGASVLLVEAEKGIAERDSQLRVAEIDIDDLETHNKQLTDERDLALTRAAQAEAQLAELGQQIGNTLAAVSSESDTMLHHADGTPYMDAMDYVDNRTADGTQPPRLRFTEPKDDQ